MCVVRCICNLFECFPHELQVIEDCSATVCNVYHHDDIIIPWQIFFDVYKNIISKCPIRVQVVLKLKGKQTTYNSLTRKTSIRGAH